MDNLDAAHSHTYLSATCVHGECTNDPYAWCNDGTVRIRGGLSQKGLGNAQTRQGVGGLFFSVGQFHAWNIRKLRKKEGKREEQQGCGPGESTMILMIVLKTYLRQNYS